MSRSHLLFLLVAAILAGCNEAEDATAPDPIRTVRTEVAKLASPTVARSFPAVLEPPQITPLAFDVGGRLGPVRLQIGQGVRAGEALATVESADTDLRLRQAEAALREAEATATNAAEEAARQETLFTRGIVSAAARDTARTAAAQAEARLDQQRRILDLERESLADTTLRAPFDGIVNSVEVQNFGTVSAGQPVVTLYEDDGLQATVLVSYEIAARLSLGTEVSVLPTDGDPTPLPATVTEIARRAPAVSSFPVVVTLDQTRPDLRSGMAVEVRVDFAAPEAMRGIPLPLTALATQNPAKLSGLGSKEVDVFVYVPGSDATGTVEPRTVRVGSVVGDRLYVIDGIGSGERVVTAGVPFLHAGREVALETDASPVLAEVAR